MRILDQEGLPYAIIGALALNEYGHRCVTIDVDLVMRDGDLQTFKARWLGRGYAERAVGTGRLVDVETGVHIDVLSTGRFPGDDKPKPIAFPDPAVSAIRGPPFAMLPLRMWVELKRDTTRSRSRNVWMKASRHCSDARSFGAK